MGHLVHDTYPAFLGPLLPLLTERLGLSLTLAGTLVSFLRSSALVQPFVGYIADRTSFRYFVILAPACTAILMSSLGLAPSYLVLVLFLMLAGVSHAAFHAPAPAMISRVAGKRLGKGMSFFMTGGELGRTLGPIYIVTVVTLLGLKGAYMAALPGILFSLVLYTLLTPLPMDAFRAPGMSLKRALRARRRPLLLLMGFLTGRALTVSNLGVFLPIYFTSGGASLFVAGVAVSVYELAGALGAFMGGTLSDRWGRRSVLLVAQLGAVPLLYAFMGSDGWFALALLAPVGLTILCTGAIGLTIVQELLPDSRSTAAGLYFSFNSMAMGLAPVLFGAVADSVGLATAFRYIVFVPLLTIPFILGLPNTRAQ